MLSGHSFNALLKTLEEPPAHVKFLLATTDPQKLPVTILSRCLQFSLKNMLPERVVEHLRHVLAEEQVPFDEESLWLLGRAADGSLPRRRCSPNGWSNSCAMCWTKNRYPSTRNPCGCSAGPLTAPCVTA